MIAELENRLLQSKFQRVALVDDKEDETLVRSAELRILGIEPVPITGRFEDVTSLADRVLQDANAVICDNFLQPGRLATFQGYELISALYERGVPGVLITQFSESLDTYERHLWQSTVPAILPKTKAPPKSILTALLKASDEVKNGHYTPQRQPVRTLVIVKRSLQLERRELVDVVIPSWDPEIEISIPAESMPKECLLSGFAVGYVNVGAEDKDLIYFSDLQPAPEPLGDMA